MSKRHKPIPGKTLAAVFAAFGAGLAGALLLPRIRASAPGLVRRFTAKSTEQPKEGPRVDATDPVEEASYESFPASDPPAFSSSDAAAGRRGAENYEG